MPRRVYKEPTEVRLKSLTFYFIFFCLNVITVTSVEPDKVRILTGSLMSPSQYSI